MIRRLLERPYRDEHGIIAVATLLMLCFCGFIVLLLLWAAGWTSGAYTALYGAAQSAAYASASEVDFGGSGESQTMFDCGSGFDSTLTTGATLCTAGRAATAAQQALAAALTRSDGSHPYGLTYGKNVFLTDTNGVHTNGVYAFEVGLAPGAAELAYQQTGTCSDVVGDVSVRSCWMNPMSTSPVRDVNFTSGVVVIAQATISLPLCPKSLLKSLCTQTITAAVPARSAQQLDLQGTGMAGKPPSISSFTPVSGKAGSVVTITGARFTGATSVTFNGYASVFTTSSATTIKAVVPTAATSGKITVTTPSGSVSTAKTFTVK